MKARNHFKKSARSLLFAGLAASAAVLLPTTVFAGSCPADKVGKNDLADAATAPVGVSDNVLSSIDLSKESVKVKGRLFRLRRLVVEPGGVVPMHEHGDRPALIYIISGEITEFSSNCSVPILHKAGEAAMESVGLTHWWKNTNSEPVVLISADLLHKESSEEHMM